MSSSYDFQIPLCFQHRIRFGRDWFRREDGSLLDLLQSGVSPRKILVLIDRGIAERDLGLKARVESYFVQREGFEFSGVIELSGGEGAKADQQVLEQVWTEIDRANVDRHSYVLAIGGGAFLDVVGFAASTAHRGVRLVRFPTTTLSQDDSGVGVKNGINAFSKKNWIGSFSVPYAVVNDFDFLHLQPEKQRREGLIEAVKVALVKEPEFFEWIEANLESLNQLDAAVLESAVERSALLHAQHIAQGGDPFEGGSSRPLDFGHWAAHKLEQMTDFKLNHAEAVAIGVALDVVYSSLSVGLSAKGLERIMKVLEGLGMPVWHEALAEIDEDGLPVVMQGLEEFREHLGGQLTVLLLQQPGKAIDCHEIDPTLLVQAIMILRLRQPCD